MEAVKQYSTNTPLASDAYKGAAMAKDLETFAGQLNALFADFVKRGFFGLNDITPEMMEAAAEFTAAPIVAAVSAMYEKEAERIKYARARLEFLKGRDNAAAEINAAVAHAKQEYERNALKYYKPNEGGFWRLRYLSLQDGSVTFDRAKLMHDCTDFVQTEKQADFLNRAKALFEEIKAFNEDCRRLSRGEVSGVDYAGSANAVITIDEMGGVIFDASVSSVMDF